MRLLALHFSQSGETARALEAFLEGWSDVADIHRHEILPSQTYPYPWKSILGFFDVMPACQLGHTPELQAAELDGDFDYCVIAYPVWFLAPALPIQALFDDQHYCHVLSNRRVITICVCRSMWHTASERLKALLQTVSATHVDNIVVKHGGNFWTTLLSTPRILLFGRRHEKDAGRVGDQDIDNLVRLGRTAAARADARNQQHELDASSLLRGEAAIGVKRGLIIPESIAAGAFKRWAQLIDRLGRVHRGLRTLAIIGFIGCLLVLIVIMPLVQLLLLPLSPMLRGRRECYAKRLASPTGEPVLH